MSFGIQLVVAPVSGTTVSSLESSVGATVSSLESSLPFSLQSGLACTETLNVGVGLGWPPIILEVFVIL